MGGRQVMDRMLEEEGEEYSHDSCQRWRQVLVEAVHLPVLPGVVWLKQLNISISISIYSFMQLLQEFNIGF